jgi:hypothetical protein
MARRVCFSKTGLVLFSLLVAILALFSASAVVRLVVRNKVRGARDALVDAASRVLELPSNDGESRRSHSPISLANFASKLPSAPPKIFGP